MVTGHTYIHEAVFWELLAMDTSYLPPILVAVMVFSITGTAVVNSCRDALPEDEGDKADKCYEC